MIPIVVVATIPILLAIFLVVFLKRKSKKKEKVFDPSEIPLGVITPIEALTLDDKELNKLKEKLKTTNEELKKEINGHIRSHTIKFSIEDNFPVESVYEIQRLYQKAGWKVDLDRQEERPYYGSPTVFWKMDFSLPESAKVPKQFVQIRVAPPVIDAVKEPSLEELGIDTLEQKFKNLEKKS